MACGFIAECMRRSTPNAYYANVNALMAKYYFGAWRPTSELVGDLARIGQLLRKGQLPL